MRVGEHQETGGPLQPEPMERALETIELFAHFCRATGIERVRPLATSAIREASNREEFLRAARKRSGLDVEVLSREEEARYGYLAAVNSTTLTDGVALDIGGGSMQLTQVADRRARGGAVVAARRGRDDRALPRRRARQAQAPQGAARARARRSSAPRRGWRGAPGRLAGIGGTVRNLGGIVMLEEGLPSYGVQGFDAAARRARRAGRAARRAHAGRAAPRARHQARARRPDPRRRRRGPDRDGGRRLRRAGGDRGRPARGRLLRGAARRGRTSRCCADVRAASVRNLAAQYHPEAAHTEHVAKLALEIWDALAAAGVHPAAPDERELLWAAAMLHDIGTAVDYDDHHKHSRYLILNAGLPGFSPRETALIGQMARYHRKGQPGLGEFAPLGPQGRRGAARPLRRGAACRRAARAPPRPDRPARAGRGPGRRRSSCGWRARWTRRSAAGAPSARRTSSAARSARS